MKKVVRHRAADQERVDPSEEVLDHLELARHLGAAEDRDEGTGRRFEQGAEMAQLGRHQQPGGRLGQMAHDAYGRRVRAMRRAESVVDVAVGWGRQGLGARRVVSLLARVKPQVLEQHDPTRSGTRHRLGHGGADRILGEHDRTAKQLGQPGRDRSQREGRVRRPFRAAEMGAEDHGGAPLERVGQRGQRGAHPGVVADDAVADRGR